MLSWRPRLEGFSGPRYLAIVEALSTDVARGILRQGDRLPTHRELARRLGVNVGTVTRAYGEARRRGLTGGEVGRGTFVRQVRRDAIAHAAEAEAARFAIDRRAPLGLADLAVNRPVTGPQAGELAASLAAVAERGNLEDILAYQPEAGAMAAREAAARWLMGLGIDVPAGRVVLTVGGQQALVAALATVTQPGDLVLTEVLTYPGLKAAANLLHLKLQGVLMDEQGLLPESLELACWSSGARVLYCMPTLQNPTAAVMSEERRHDVVEIARRYGVTIIEDDVCGVLHPEPPARFATLAPERTCYLTSFSKAIAPGLRVGFAVAPEGRTGALAGAIRSTTWMATPLMVEIVGSWILDGTADRLLAWQREQAEARRAMAVSRLDGFELATGPGGLHAWLNLPEPWRAEEFTRQAREAGVAISPAELFAAGRSSAPQAVRLCLGGPPTIEDLRAALDVLAGLLGASPEPRLPIL